MSTLFKERYYEFFKTVWFKVLGTFLLAVFLASIIMMGIYYMFGDKIYETVGDWTVFQPSNKTSSCVAQIPYENNKAGW